MSHKIDQALAVSALLGKQFGYYQEIQPSTAKTRKIAYALGMNAPLHLIQWFLSDIRDSKKMEYLFPLIEGLMQGDYPQDSLDFLEEQVHIHSAFSPHEQNILRSKAIGLAQAGNIEESKRYLQTIHTPDYRESISHAAAENGYSSGAKQLYGLEHPLTINRMLFNLAQHGFIDRLPTLIDGGRDVNTILQYEYDPQYMFSVGFNPLWHKESAKHYLARISDDRVMQFLLPGVRQKFGATITHEIKEYTRKINGIRTKYKLNYPQAACFVWNPEYNLKPFNYMLWVSNQLPCTISFSDSSTLTLPNEIAHRITSFFSPVSPLLDTEANELHNISFKPKT